MGFFSRLFLQPQEVGFFPGGVLPRKRLLEMCPRGGGYFGLKRIGMTVGNPKKYQATKFEHPKIYLLVKN